MQNNEYIHNMHYDHVKNLHLRLITNIYLHKYYNKHVII